MAWNEPGKDKDPWRDAGRGSEDLDAWLRDINRKLSSFFGGSGGGDDNRLAVTVIGVLVALGWLALGFYTVDAAERGVVQRFGAYLETTGPGLHWRLPPPIDSVSKVNVDEVDDYPHRTTMLTRDENIIVIDMTVQFRASEAEKFLFNVRDPRTTLEEVSESAIREVVGKNDLDYILGEGRSDVSMRTETLIQSTLDSYETGILVTDVNLQDAQFPEQVQSAVQDAIKAREDRERHILRAEGYRNDILPRAQGAAARRVAEAEAYREQRIAEAGGETARFEALLTEYRKAPVVTRQRMYLETLEQVYGDANKIIIDAQGNNLMYLPLQEILGGRGSGDTTGDRSTREGAFSGAGASGDTERQRSSGYPTRPTTRDRTGG